MAKKKIKNFKLEQNELTPVTIGIFESRKRSSIGIFIVITIFVLAVFFLPEISNIIDKWIHPSVAPITTPTEPKPITPTPEEPGEEKEDMHQYKDNLRIENDEVVISDFKLDKENLLLNYTVVNNLSAPKNMEELGYFLEIYNKDNTLLERIKLSDNLTLASGGFINYERNIGDNTAKNIANLKLVAKTSDEYPAVELAEGAMVCKRNHEEVTYKFKDSGLEEITSLITYKKEDKNYDNIYKEMKITSTEYNTKQGITSNWIDFDGGFSITTSVDLSKSERLFIFNADSFKNKETPSVVKFEMEAQGFKCNIS